MLDQVVAPHEALVAQGAQEALLSCVSASMAGELVGAGELLLAVRPGAREGSLPCRTETFYYHINILKMKLLFITCAFFSRSNKLFLGVIIRNRSSGVILQWQIYKIYIQGKTPSYFTLLINDLIKKKKKSNI